MTAEPNNEQFQAAMSSANFAELRSRLLDGFAELEVAVCASLVKLSSSERKGQLSSKLEELATLKPSSNLSKLKTAELKALADDCRLLLPVRAAIVHSVMQTGLRGKEPVVFFHNIALKALGDLSCLIMKEADFHQLIEKLSQLHKRLRIVISPPSPPRPSPAAATGP